MNKLDQNLSKSNQISENFLEPTGHDLPQDSLTKILDSPGGICLSYLVFTWESDCDRMPLTELWYEWQEAFRK